MIEVVPLRYTYMFARSSSARRRAAASVTRSSDWIKIYGSPNQGLFAIRNELHHSLSARSFSCSSRSICPQCNNVNMRRVRVHSDQCIPQSGVVVARLHIAVAEQPVQYHTLAWCNPLSEGSNLVCTRELLGLTIFLFCSSIKASISILV